MTLWKQGRPLFPFLPASDHFWIRRHRHRRHVCPEQTEPLAPRCACPPTSPISFSRIRLRGANDGEAAAAPCRPTLGERYASTPPRSTPQATCHASHGNVNCCVSAG